MAGVKSLCAGAAIGAGCAGGIACELSTDAVVATGAAGCGAEPGAATPAAEAGGWVGWIALWDAVSVLVTPEVSGAFALVLLIRGT